MDKRHEEASKEIARRRLEAQQLASPTFTRPAEVVAWLGAVQAQDYLGALWAVGIRLADGHEAYIERALAERTIVRSWPMRGTLHFMAAADARWMIELLAPRAAAAGAGRLRAAGIDEAVVARARKALVPHLEGGQHLTRPGAYRVLEAAGIPTEGQRGIFILWQLAHEGFLCFGPREGKQQTFVLLEEWLPDAKSLPRDEALAEIARRYFAGHGPATPRDFAWWSGLSLTEARRAIDLAGSLLVEETLAGQRFLSARAALSGGPSQDGERAHALPAFDELLVGYAEREAAVDPATLAALRMAELLGPVMLVDGRVVATWKRRLARGKVICSTMPAAPLNATKRAAMKRALGRYARFLGLDVEVEEVARTGISED